MFLAASNEQKDLRLFWQAVLVQICCWMSVVVVARVAAKTGSNLLYLELAVVKQTYRMDFAQFAIDLRAAYSLCCCGMENGLRTTVSRLHQYV